MVKIIFQTADGDSRVIEAPDGANLMHTAIGHAVEGIDADCGGALACATCHVRIHSSWLPLLPPPADTERAMLEFAVEPDERSRLACQLSLTPELDGLVVLVPAAQH